MCGMHPASECVNRQPSKGHNSSHNDSEPVPSDAAFESRLISVCIPLGVFYHARSIHQTYVSMMLTQTYYISESATHFLLTCTKTPNYVHCERTIFQ